MPVALKPTRHHIPDDGIRNDILPMDLYKALSQKGICWRGSSKT
jgi:hypothetical protein